MPFYLKSLDLLFARNYVAFLCPSFMLFSRTNFHARCHRSPVIYRNLRACFQHHCRCSRSLVLCENSQEGKTPRNNEASFVAREKIMENLIKYLSTHIFIAAGGAFSSISSVPCASAYNIKDRSQSRVGDELCTLEDAASKVASNGVDIFHSFGPTPPGAAIRDLVVVDILVAMLCCTCTRYHPSWKLLL